VVNVQTVAGSKPSTVASGSVSCAFRLAKPFETLVVSGAKNLREGCCPLAGYVPGINIPGSEIACRISTPHPKEAVIG
jgi:hypothetical protein